MDRIYYRLAPQFKVRKEFFGLLFYNTGSTKLYFVKYKELLDQSLLAVEGDEIEFLRDNSPKSNVISRILKQLVNRGFLFEKGLSL